jgi:hypothetical protein
MPRADDGRRGEAVRDVVWAVRDAVMYSTTSTASGELQAHRMQFACHPVGVKFFGFSRSVCRAGRR